ATLAITDGPSPPFKTATVPLIGMGIPGFSETDRDRSEALRLGRFEEVAIGCYRVHLGRLAGGEAGPLKVTGVRITGRDAAAFQAGPELVGATVAPGAARDFWIRFSPRHAGPHTAALVVSRSPSPQYSDWTIPLSGKGIEGRIDCGIASVGASVEVKRLYF